MKKIGGPHSSQISIQLSCYERKWIDQLWGGKKILWKAMSQSCKRSMAWDWYCNNGKAHKQNALDMQSSSWFCMGIFWWKAGSLKEFFSLWFIINYISKQCFSKQIINPGYIKFMFNMRLWIGSKVLKCSFMHLTGWYDACTCTFPS